MRLEHLLSGETSRGLNRSCGRARVRDVSRRVAEGLDKRRERYKERNPRAACGAHESRAGLPGFLNHRNNNIYDTRPAAAVPRRARANPRRRGFSSAGRAPALQAGGQRFESVILHRKNEVIDMLGTRRVKSETLRPRGGRRIAKSKREIELKEKSSDNDQGREGAAAPRPPVRGTCG